jgi:hypothetical protein
MFIHLNVAVPTYKTDQKGKDMTTPSKPKTLEEVLAEADELTEQINSEFLEDLEDEHRAMFEQHVQRLQEIKSAVQVKAKEKGTMESFSSAEGMHEAVMDIVKAMKDLSGYFASSGSKRN